MAGVKSRSSTDHFLLGQEEESVRGRSGSGNKLLLTKDMMRYFMYRKNLPQFRGWTLASIVCCPLSTGTNTAKCQTQDATECVGGGLCVVAGVKGEGNGLNSGIPLMSDLSIRDKIMKINKVYRDKIMKHKSKNSTVAKAERDKFLTDIDSLFDIAAPDAIELIQKDRLRLEKDKDEDIKFLMGQRSKEQVGSLGSNDKRFEKSVSNKKKRLDNEARRSEAVAVSESSVVDVPDMFDDADVESDLKDKDFVVNEYIDISLPVKGLTQATAMTAK